MDAIRGMKAASRRQGRRWRFASAVLDESSWTLHVDGRRVPLEVKPMELLHELLLHAGKVVTKDELLDAVWPGLAVVEASLPTAMLKLRRALGDQGTESPVIETVQRIGYRLAVPVEVESVAEAGTGAEVRREPSGDASLGDEAPGVTRRRRRWPLAVLGLAIALAAGTALTVRTLHDSRERARLQAVQMRDGADAIRRMDVPRIEQLLHEGWDPNAPYDEQGNGAIVWALNICEWNPAHDRQRLLLVVRTLIDGGARLDNHNVWGDTPYTISSARRYCGPDHPVTRMIGIMCYRDYPRTGSIPAGNFCAPGPSRATPAQQRHANLTAG